MSSHLGEGECTCKTGTMCKECVARMIGGDKDDKTKTRRQAKSNIRPDSPSDS